MFRKSHYSIMSTSSFSAPGPWGSGETGLHSSSCVVGAQLYSSTQRRPIAMHLVLLVRLPNTELSNFDFSIIRIIHDASSSGQLRFSLPGHP